MGIRTTIQYILIIMAFGLMIYSLIRWSYVAFKQKDDMEKRKKYSRLCRISMILFAVIEAGSFIINLGMNI